MTDGLTVSRVGIFGIKSWNYRDRFDASNAMLENRARTAAQEISRTTGS